MINHQASRPSSSRPSPAMGPHPPPPYRAPPPLYNNTTPSKPYSKFNVSEPNMTLGPTRHTFNAENGHHVQSNLRHLLASTPKHSTLDGQGQNVMLQHLRNSGLQENSNPANLKNGSYVSPENLRDAANRMFHRGQNDRNSFGGVALNYHSQDPSKRHSYSNQSFRKAMEQPKVPPQVPPKPHGKILLDPFVIQKRTGHNNNIRFRF